MAITIPQPPFTPAEPVVDLIHGIDVADPYRWLEDQFSPRTRHWIEEQVRYNRAYFDGIPYREQIRTQVTELLSANVVSEIWNVGDRYFFPKRHLHAEQPAIVMRTGLFGEDKVLIDPALRGTPSSFVKIAAISDDARFLAYSVRQSGTDHYRLEILNIPRSRVLEDSLPEGFCNGIVFAPDGCGFYYSHRALNGPRRNYRAAFWHRYGTDPLNDQEIFFAGDDPNLFLGILHSSKAKVLAYLAFSTGRRRSASLYIQSMQRNSAPELLLRHVEGCFVPFFVRDQLLAYTDLAAPNRRIVHIDWNHPDPKHWRDVVPESDQAIQQFATVDDQVFVTRVHRFSASIERFGLDGQRKGDIAIPPRGTISLLNRTRENDRLFFSYTSIRKPPTAYCYNPREDKLDVWQRSVIPFNASAIFIEETSYRSKDGTSVPILLAGRRDFFGSGPLPTFITGYGGFGSCVTPRFTAFTTFLINQGLLFAVPAVRGGSELGQGWHRAGQRENRQKSFEDFITAAEWLVAKGLSAADRISIGGGSNAGLLVGAAISQRPDLFRAAVCLGPLLDMVRYHLFDLAVGWADEYGTPEDEEDFKSLWAYSPYHRVKDAVSYPAVMLISGDADTRCNPMHARKMTARLQAANNSKHPILLDYKSSWGHTPVQPLGTRIEALTDRLAFICHELGIKVHTQRH